MLKVLKAAALLGILGLAGCGTSETVYLKHPVKGYTVKCGPYTVAGNLNLAAATAQNELRYCVKDFQRQGYERTPQPRS